MELISAKEARIKVQLQESEKAKLALDNIIILINSAIENKAYGICYDGFLPSSVVKKLEIEGYKVKRSKQNEPFTSISW